MVRRKILTPREGECEQSHVTQRTSKDTLTLKQRYLITQDSEVDNNCQMRDLPGKH